MSDIKLSNDTAMTTPGMETSHSAFATYAIANVFFDGTENNYFNVKVDQAVKEAQHKKGNDSYINDLSNVARMWESISNEKEFNAVYIDGIGTTRGEDDSTWGLAVGRGATGVAQRAESAFAELEKKFTKNLGKNDLPPLLHINVYGFSRGSAAARYFVHLVKTEASKRFTGKLKEVHTDVNFVGLFDTVSSVFLDLQGNVKSLHLEFARDSAHKVFHIRALDEYRDNFPVTTAASALDLIVANHEVSHVVGYEIAIPGAHSDVGGGYVDGDKEERFLDSWHQENRGKGDVYQLPGPSTRDFVYAQGWYQPGPPEQDGESGWHSRKVSNEYYKVSLTLMVDMTLKHGQIEFNPKFLKEAEPQDGDIQSVLNALRPLVAAEKPVNQRLEDLVGTDKAKAIRHQHLHVSFNDRSFANPPRRNRKGEFERKIIKG